MSSGFGEAIVVNPLLMEIRANATPRVDGKGSQIVAAHVNRPSDF
jgi:hypothetical protein